MRAIPAARRTLLFADHEEIQDIAASPRTKVEMDRSALDAELGGDLPAPPRGASRPSRKRTSARSRDGGRLAHNFNNSLPPS